LDIDLSARLLRKLDMHQADLVLLPGSVPLPRAMKVPLGSSRLRWMSRPGLLPRRRHFLPVHVAAVPIITLSRDANASAVMEAWFNDAGVKPHRVDYCNSLTVVASLVRDGFGVSLLPEDLFMSGLETGEFVVLPERPLVPKVDYWAVYLPVPELPILPRIAALAREESWFLQNGDHLWRELRRY
jgi:DNA-binding transcriptional LysR family regulator